MRFSFCSCRCSVDDRGYNLIWLDERTILDRVDPADVDGIFAVMGDVTVQWGTLPPLVRAVVDEQLISAGDRQ